ncbi:unnamed protein product [Kuraishia capsulata CBS 1993]|uniref:protein-tyrosine-phosphatase n=1 Tax=Kuraishia capsulata CBS 1993 TaxID=1382522 RepID=W6MNC9_9ASCO|nr:uncharacterized protein KUCA_T00002494001 [Kuraishia capsulata CBS 1993]CDK26522.1 unnamed protein product [Kuraishia capsulata CBS 1993]
MESGIPASGDPARRAKNMKNLQLDLTANGPYVSRVRSSTVAGPSLDRRQFSPIGPSMFSQIGGSAAIVPSVPPPSLLRTMSMNTHKEMARPLQRRRTTTLSLAIPSEFPPTGNNEDSSSPASSPLVPATPSELQQTWSMNVSQNQDDDMRSTEYDIPEESRKVNAYPDGPVCVLDSKLYLYSEPTIEQIESFDIIINVAKELKNYSDVLSSANKPEYYFVPWTHSSKLSPDFPKLCGIIDTGLQMNKRVLVHCQCGVSRSASLIVAYFMKKLCLGYNDAYSLLKVRAPSICPNLSLIYELMEWGKALGYNIVPPSPDNPIDRGVENRDNVAAAAYDVVKSSLETQTSALSLHSVLSSSKSSLLLPSPSENSFCSTGLGIQSSECITSP